MKNKGLIRKIGIGFSTLSLAGSLYGGNNAYAESTKLDHTHTNETRLSVILQADGIGSKGKKDNLKI